MTLAATTENENRGELGDTPNPPAGSSLHPLAPHSTGVRSCTPNRPQYPWGRLRLHDRIVHSLANLSSCGVAARPERAICVAGDHLTVVCGLHVLVEGVARGHV